MPNPPRMLIDRRTCIAAISAEQKNHVLQIIAAVEAENAQDQGSEN